jgi:hypothetical protein
MKKLTQRQEDSILVNACLEAYRARRKAIKATCEQIITQGAHDWRVECLRTLHRLKRAKPFIALAENGIESIEPSPAGWIRHDGFVEVTITVKGGTIEYAFKATKQLRTISKRVEDAQDERNRQIHRRQHGAYMLRDKLSAATPAATKARNKIIRAVAELLRDES